MAFVVVLDACVLVPHPLFDTLLRAADAGMYEPRWSAQILTEVGRTLEHKLGMDRERANGRISAMRQAFPGSEVSGHEDLIAAMSNRPKDRYVLAAAVRSGAGLIVTANLKDFPPESLDRFEIEARHPDDFLLDLLDLDPESMLEVLDEQIHASSNPPVTRGELARQLRATVPRFAGATALTSIE